METYKDFITEARLIKQSDKDGFLKFRLNRAVFDEFEYNVVETGGYEEDQVITDFPFVYITPAAGKKVKTRLTYDYDFDTGIESVGKGIKRQMLKLAGML